MSPGNTTIRVVVIDDQPAIRKHAQFLVEKYQGFTVAACCGSVQEALVVIPAARPDLLLLDIQLGDGSGFDILEKIESNIKVIFLTAFEQHAIRAVKIGALDYLLKPLDEAELQTALDRALQSPPFELQKLALAKKHFNQTGYKIYIPTATHWQAVDTREIMYCESGSGVTIIHLAGKKKLLSSKFIKHFEKQLPANQFFRFHKSFLVNLDFIDQFHKGGYLVMQNGIKIPIATRKREWLRNILTWNH